MTRLLCLFLVSAVVVAGPGARSAHAIDPVTVYVGTFLLEKFILDDIWDGITGKPDIKKLAERLDQLERDAAINAEQREEIRKLRERIDKGMTRNEFETFVKDKFLPAIEDLGKRVSLLEQDRAEDKVRIQDLEESTPGKNSKNPAAFLMRGDAFAAENEHRKAIANYSVALKLNPNHVLALIQRGKVFAAMKSHGIAIVDFTEALKREPKNGDASRLRGESFLELNDDAKAAKDLEAAVAANAKDGRALGRLARAYNGLQQYDKAVTAATSALAIDSQDAFACCRRGIAFDYLGKHDEARKDLDKAVQLTPNDARAWVLRGENAMNRQQYKAAEEDFSAALKLTADDLDALVCRADALNKQDRHLEGLRDAERAIQIKPTYAGAHFQRGLALFPTDKDKAMVAISKAIELDAKFDDAYVWRGHIQLHAKNQPDAAIADFSRALELNPKYVFAWHARASAHNRKGAFDKAIADANAALNLDKKSADAFSQRGFASQRTNNFTQAIADFSEVIGLRPKDAMAHNSLGIAYQGKREHEKAVAAFGDAIRLNANHPYAYQNRGESWQVLGKKDEAEKDYAIALGSSIEGVRTFALEKLLELNTKNAKLYDALPNTAHLNKRYGTLLARVSMPEDKSWYGASKDYGWFVASKAVYAKYRSHPTGYWVYDAPYWYIWSEKK